MPGQEKKTSVFAVVLSGPKVKTGGRDVTVSKFSVDVPESWNEKDISSVLNTAADVPRGVWLEILKSEDGGKTVVPFKTSRAKPLDGRMISSEKIKTLYLRPSKALFDTPASPASDRTSKSGGSVKSPERSTNSVKDQGGKKGRGRPPKSQPSPDKKEKVKIESKGDRSESKAHSESGRSSKTAKEEPKAKNESEGSRNESRTSRTESRSSGAESKTESKREVSRSPLPRKGDKRGRSPVKRQAQQKGGKEADAKSLKSPSRPAVSPDKPVERDSRSVKSPAVPAKSPGRPTKRPGRPAKSPGKPARSPGRPAKSRGRPAKSPEKPAKSPGRPVKNSVKPAEGPAASPASTSRGRGRPAKSVASPEGPKKPSESMEKSSRSSRNETKSPEKAATAKSPGRPSRNSEKPEETSDQPARGRGRPPKSDSKGRGRPPKSPSPVAKSPSKPKESPKKPTKSPRTESRGRGRPASTAAKAQKDEKAAESPQRSDRGQSAAKSPAVTSRGKEESSPVRSPSKHMESPKTKDDKKEEDSKEKRGRGRPPSKSSESSDKKDSKTDSPQPRKRGRPRLDESVNKKDSESSQSRGRKVSESASPVKSPKKGGRRSPSKSSDQVAETPTTEKRQRRAPRKFEDYDSDIQPETKKPAENSSVKEAAKAQDKKEQVKKGAAKKGQEKENKVEEEKETIEAAIESPQEQDIPQEVAESRTPDASLRKRKASVSADEASPDKPSPKQKKTSLGMLKVKMAFKGKEKETEPRVRAHSLSPTPKVLSQKAQGERPKSLSPPRGKILLLPAKSGNLESPVRKVYVPSISDLMTGRKDIEPRNRPVTCLDCGEIVANRDQLYHHKARCASIGMHRVFACQDCPSSYYSRSDLISHRRREHFKNPGSHMIERYGKPDEGEMGMGSWDVSGHAVKALVSGVNGKDYNICICMACRAVFVSNEMLEAHMKEMHPEHLLEGANKDMTDGEQKETDKDQDDDHEKESDAPQDAVQDDDGDKAETDIAADKEEAGPSRTSKGDSPVKKSNTSTAKKPSESPSKTGKELPARKATTQSSAAKKAEASPGRNGEESPTKKTTRGTGPNTDESKDEPQKSAKTTEKKQQAAKETKPTQKKNEKKIEIKGKAEPAESKTAVSNPVDDAASRRSSRKRKPIQWMKDYVESEEEVVKKTKPDEVVSRGRPRKSLLVVTDQVLEETVRRQVVKPQGFPKKRSHDDEELGFLCEECDAGCRSAKELEMHIMDVHRIQCQCGKKFMYRADLECHKIVSCSAATWHCFECDHNFESRQAYNDHKDDCTSSEFKCPHCGMQSLNAKDHNKHRAVCNSRVMCKICNLYFLNKEVLLTHMEKRHMLDKDKSKKDSEGESSEVGQILGTVTAVPDDTEEEEITPSKRSTRSRGQKSPQKIESPNKGASNDNDKPSVSKTEPAEKADVSQKSPAKTSVKQTEVKSSQKPATPSTGKVQKEVRFDVKQAPEAKSTKSVSSTPVASTSSSSTPKTPADGAAAANKNVSFIVSASQLNELMSGGQDKLMKFLSQQMKQPEVCTPQTKTSAAVSPVRKPAVKFVSAKTGKATPAVQTKPQVQSSAKVQPVEAKTPVNKPAQDKQGTPASQDASKMSFVVTASQLKELMKGGKDSLKSFVSSQMKKTQPQKIQPTITTPVAKPVPSTSTPTPKPVASPKKPVAPENDPRLRRAIPLSPPKPKVPSPPPKTVIESPSSPVVEETVNIPVGNSCINIPMSIIQSHIAEASPEGTTKQLVVTTSEGVPYSVFVNANEDGSNIQIRLEKIEDEESLLALQGLQAPSPPSPPKPSKTIQVVTVSQPETQEVTVMPPNQAGPSSQPSILRKRRLSEELVESAATASTMSKVPKLGNLGQYKIHCKDCQLLFDNYSLFTRHGCVQKAQEKKKSPSQTGANPVVIQPAASQPTVQTPTQFSKYAAQGKKHTYFECSCCHQVFSSMLLFNRHVCNTENQEGTEWKVQSLGSGGNKTGNSEVEWLIAEAGSN